MISGIGALLLAAVFFYAAAGAVRRAGPSAGGDGDGIVIRFAHDNVHESVRRALAKIKADYEQLHPGVTIEINEVPGRIWNQWMRTQLVGGIAPDLMKAATSLSDADLALFFEPLTAAMAEPNPYNRGTTLEHWNWRDTFIDGLSNVQSFPPALMEVYRLPFHGTTNRVFYNRTLFKEATGSEDPPRTFDEFVALCDALRTYAKQHELALVPMAAAAGEDNNVALFNRILEQQTQQLAPKIGPLLI